MARLCTGTAAPCADPRCSICAPDRATIPEPIPPSRDATLPPPTPPAPPPDPVDEARRIVRQAADAWSPIAVRALAYVVGLGEPVEVLARARGLAARGVGAAARGPDAMPPTSASEWAIAGVLGLYRDVGAALGVQVVPPPTKVLGS